MTPQQRHVVILSHIHRFYRQHGRGPTVMQIRLGCRFLSNSLLNADLTHLVNAGKVRRTEARTFELIAEDVTS